MDANKLNGFLMGIILTAVVGGGAWYWTSAQLSDSQMQQVPEEEHASEQQAPDGNGQTNAQQISHNPVPFSENTERYQILSIYPEVTGIDADINEAVAALSERKVDAFKEEVSDVMADPDYPTTSNFDMTYDVVALNDDLASFVFTISTYQAGAAHPLTVKEGFTYDFEREIPMSLSDVLEEHDLTLEDISEASREDLAQQFEEADMYDEFMQDWVNDGTMPEWENFDDFAYDGETLTVYFNPYQVAPYAAGIQTVDIEL